MSPTLPPFDHSTLLGRSWSWVAALQRGTTIPWPLWRDDETTPSERPTTLPYLPGAQQLELLRRTNAVAHARGRTVPAGLADRILRAGSTDRGRGDLPLNGGELASFGPPAVDPTTLPATELLRVAAGLIARDLAIAPLPARPPAGRRGRQDLVGDPWAIRFAADGGWRRRLWARRTGAVLGTDLATLAAHAWADRCLDGAGSDLGGWLAERCGPERLPAVLDLAAHARRTAQRYGMKRTHIVLDTGLMADRRFPISLPEVDLDDLELIRRVGRALGTLLPADQRRDTLEQMVLRQAAERSQPAATTWSVPEPFLSLLHEHAERQVQVLRRHRYPVLGQLNGIVPNPAQGPGEPDQDRVLARAIDLTIDLHREETT